MIFWALIAALCAAAVTLAAWPRLRNFAGELARGLGFYLQRDPPPTGRHEVTYAGYFRGLERAGLPVPELYSRAHAVASWPASDIWALPAGYARYFVPDDQAGDPDDLGSEGQAAAVLAVPDTEEDWTADTLAMLAGAFADDDFQPTARLASWTYTAAKGHTWAAQWRWNTDDFPAAADAQGRVRDEPVPLPAPPSADAAHAGKQAAGPPDDGGPAALLRELSDQDFARWWRWELVQISIGRLRPFDLPAWEITP